MAHELFRLTEKIFNTPQLVHPQHMGMIAAYLNERNIALAVSPPKPTPTEKTTSRLAYDTSTQTGVIEIRGTLTNVAFEPMCGEENCSYEQIETDFKELVNSGAKTIVLDVSSNGGEAYGCFQAAEVCREVATANGVKIITYVDGVAFSAAYAWASIADELIANPMAEVGSVGVVVRLVNFNRYDKERGVDTTYLYAGANKIPFDAQGAFTESFLSGIQEKIDVFYTSFVTFVAKNRNMTVDAVKSTEAETYLPEKALALGLIDKVMTKNDFISYIFKGNN